VRPAWPCTTRFTCELRRLCDQYQVHLIADEIAVGFGRTGTLFACEQAGIKPDFLCLSKGITGGFLPLSCVLSTDTIYQAFYHDDVTRGFCTPTATPAMPWLQRRAGRAGHFADEDIIARNRELAATFTDILAPLAERADVRHFRHTGMIWAFDVESPRADFAQAFFSAMLKLGCLVRPIGKTVYFMPPYVMQPEMMQLFQATCTVLDALHQENTILTGPVTALP
jgi:adenosylmethionine-8-amino-7-oxononanoate aminotransferase